MADVVLKETAMIRVGNARVGCGNLWERDYPLPDGTTLAGMSARVVIEGQEAFFAGVGSEMVIDGERYRVAAIDKTPGKLGHVKLDRL